MKINHQNKEREKKRSFLKGIFYGILPHIFCILFIIFSILGATTATVLLRPFLLNPYFFHILIAVSLLFATLSAIVYLKKNGILSFSGVKRKWKYLSILYGTTIFVNLLFFYGLFPYLANLDRTRPEKLFEDSILSSLTLKVQIPCPGHAPLIIQELKKINGIDDVEFKFPNLFQIKFNPKRIDKIEILSLEIFQTFKVEMIKENDSLEREKILSQLYSAIEKAKKEGKYKCCIQPPCTMCYLGNWIFEDGVCDCEEMIEKKDFGKVCPQCLEGIKEGKCKSKSGTCFVL